MIDIFSTFRFNFKASDIWFICRNFVSVLLQVIRTYLPTIYGFLLVYKSGTVSDKRLELKSSMLIFYYNSIFISFFVYKFII